MNTARIISIKNMTWLTGSEPTVYKSVSLVKTENKQHQRYNPDGNRRELNNQRTPGIPALNQQEERRDQRKQDEIE